MIVVIARENALDVETRCIERDSSGHCARGMQHRRGERSHKTAWSLGVVVLAFLCSSPPQAASLSHITLDLQNGKANPALDPHLPHEQDRPSALALSRSALHSPESFPSSSSFPSAGVLRMRGGARDDSPRRSSRKGRPGSPPPRAGSPPRRAKDTESTSSALSPSFSSLVSSVRSKSERVWEGTKLRLQGVMKHKSAKQAQELVRKMPQTVAAGLGVSVLSFLFLLSGLSLKDILLAVMDFTILTPKAIKTAFLALINVATDPKLALAVTAAMLQRLREGLKAAGVGTWEGVKGLLGAVLEAKDQVVLAVYGVVMALISATGRLSGLQVASYLWDTRIKGLVVGNYFRQLRVKMQWWRWCVSQWMKGTSRPNLRPSLVHMTLLGQNLAELVQVPLEAGSTVLQRLFTLGVPTTQARQNVISRLLRTVASPFKLGRGRAGPTGPGGLMPVKRMFVPGQGKGTGNVLMPTRQNAASYLAIVVLYVSWVGYTSSLGGSIPESVMRAWDFGS